MWFARDIDLFRKLDLGMIGVGPYIFQPATPVGKGEWSLFVPDEKQVPHTEEMTYKVMALSRIVCPEANIPSTTALATINIDHVREPGLMRGANVVMPNLTPAKYRAMYEIYPSEARIGETASGGHFFMSRRMEAIGRRVGIGRGDRVHRVGLKFFFPAKIGGELKNESLNRKALLL
jgi:biotin synthase